MTDIRLAAGDMSSAADAVRAAGQLARSADGSGEIRGAAVAVPGSSAEDLLDPMASQWESDVTDWYDEAEGFADALGGHSADMTSTDSGLGGLLGRWRGMLGVGG